MLLKERHGFEAETTPRTFTPDLRGLIAWLETQPGKTKYDYMSVTDCVLCRFGAATGYVLDYEANRTYVDLIEGHFLDDPRLQASARNGDWTYAAALTRARSLLDRSA